MRGTSRDGWSPVAFHLDYVAALGPVLQTRVVGFAVVRRLTSSEADVSHIK